MKKFEQRKHASATIPIAAPSAVRPAKNKKESESMAAKEPKSAKSKPLVDEGNLKTATERPVAVKKLDATLSTLVADGQPRKRGRPPSATKGAPKPFVEKGRPKILKETHLDDQNMLLPLNERPLTGRDLATLSRKFELTVSEFGAALGIQNDYTLAKTMKNPTVVPFDVEMLARMYMDHPSPTPWPPKSPKLVFDTLYRPMLDRFEDERERAYARSALFSRFTATMDRSSSTAYRWMESKGNSRLVVTLLLRKTMSLAQPLEELERLAALVHYVRGGDFDLRGPRPVLGIEIKRRGRLPVLERDEKAELRMYESDPFANLR